MAVIHVEGRACEVRDGQNLLQAVLGLGFDLPYFCWHPALGSVGACRQCAVKQFKDADDPTGRIVMACMTPAADGARISIHDPEAVALRRSVIEWLMANHPHDCPVCDEGGECHLQDMTVMTGHAYRRHRFPKRTFRNQDLGPLLHHEMNRCIHCFRCVRFYGDHAGGTDLAALGSRHHTYFGRFADGPLQSPFAGNLVEVCPTGVFTDRTLRGRFTRKWDLQTAPSICVHCGLGCNTILGERYSRVRRVLNRYHGEVNGYFLCDRGRFGVGLVSGPGRGLVARVDGVAVSAAEALARAGEILGAGGRVLGIGSPRASLESNFALRARVGGENFRNGLSPAEADLARTALGLLRATPARVVSLREVEQADAALVLGEDVTNTAPRLDLALRQAARRAPARGAEALGIPPWNDAFVRLVEDGRHGPIHLATPAATALDGLARTRTRALPEEIARLGRAVAHEIDAVEPEATDLADAHRATARAAAADLLAAERPLVVAGAGALSAPLLHAAAGIARALTRQGKSAGLCLVVPECNTLGVSLLSDRAADPAEGDLDAAIVLENDLARRWGGAALERWLAGVRHLIVIDACETPLASRAAVFLPAAAFAEASGTLLSAEGRLQRFAAVVPPPEPGRAAWRWLRELGAGRWGALEEIATELATEVPALGAVRELAGAGARVPRQSHRRSGRAVEVRVPPPADPDSPLVFSMEGDAGPPPAAAIPRYWAPGWNSVQALNKLQDEIAGPLRGGDPGRRIFELEAGGAPAGGGRPAEPVPPGPDARRVVPLHHLFGSEELSARAPAVATLVPAPYAAMNAGEAARLGAAPGDPIAVTAGDETRELPLRIASELPDGALGLPAGLPGAADLIAALRPGEPWARARRAGAP
jgi:NADH-quinone oxidoreductase subunit G